tara:strand:- start:509 stop:616 length:108 start_codon:yes stop_codon:yes gene_type:complete
MSIFGLILGGFMIFVVFDLIRIALYKAGVESEDRQ